MTSSSWHWKTWLLSNFEHCEGKLLAVRELLADGEKLKENVPCKASSSLFGLFIKQIWGEKVKLVKRGSSKQGRQNFYLGLARKSPTTTEENQPIAETPLKPGWHLLNDQGGHLSFVRYEPWSFRKQRVVTEVRVADSVSLTSHGCQIDLTNFFKQECLEKLPTSKRIEIILTFVDTSNLCLGVPIKEGEVSSTIIPHESGDLATTEATERRAFSSNCSVLASAGQCCSNCKNLQHLEKKREKRKLASNGPSPFTNKRYLSKDEVAKQLKIERQARINAERRETYWREKFEAQCIEMEKDDHTDLCKMFEDVGDHVPESMTSLWEQQQNLLKCKSKNAYRWHPKIMRLCLDLYCKNPYVLDPLRQFIILPSNKTIRMYKNKVKETPGWNEEVLMWCLNAAKENGLKPGDFMGGFAIDEMKIQENLGMTSENGKHKLVGFVDLGIGHDIMRTLSGEDSEPELATHVLQFVFLSDGGFRFPIAQWPSANCTPSDLYHLFWEGVLKMLEIGFEIYWCVLDGADCNRQFIKIHFKGKDPADSKFMTTNIYTGCPMIFIMDPKHNIKKIWNNIYKSNKTGNPRCLKIGEKPITWKQFRSAFDWDQQSFSLPLHEKLTQQHLNLDSASIMRNKLAEDVLDAKMLFLMQA
ncbi:hypothetical protein ACROYT_G008763 [Oculina patagonica]